MQAVETALELTDDPVDRAEIYAELAFEGSLRSGMWRSRPAREVMDDWTTRALAGVRERSVPHVKALVARAFWGFPDAEESAILASRLAEDLDDVGLRSCSLDARAVAAFRNGDFETAHMWETRRFDFLADLTDPDLIHDLYLSTIPTASAVGRLREARRLSDELQEVVAELTPHHRLHGVACKLEVDELAGDWDAVLRLEDDTVRAVEENRDTPCVRNARSLLVCALANELAGDSERSHELEAVADELKNEGYGSVLAAPRARLALLREEVDLLHDLFADEDWLTRQTWFALPAAATRLDALAVIGRANEVEQEAAKFAPPGSYLEPFALRARALVRDDDALLARAHERFRALKLDWHAAQTDSYIRLRKASA